MFINDILHREKVYDVVCNNLRTLGVKYRIKKSTINKIEKLEKSHGILLKKVFNTSLSHLPLDVVNLSSGAIVHVPTFVSQTTQFILKNVSQEGLFRKAGSQSRQKELQGRLDNGGSLGDKNNPLDVANCLKAFFRNLPEPLIPFAYHELFVRCNMLKSNKMEALLLSCLILPIHHLNTLAFFMEFLKKVASYEKQNKMSIDNLAKVIGPNIMPLQETTMIAVQSRLEAHLSIVKALIENAEHIGVIPEEISEAISMDSIGSIDNEFDRSDHSLSFQQKKKKHRSGSLTRMFSGLRKIVGKNNSPNGHDMLENRLLSCDSSHVPYKAAKKRKVADTSELLNGKKQGTSENKIEKSKKMRLSLERFVPKNKNKHADQIDEILKNYPSPCMERRWSITSPSETKRKDIKKDATPHSLLSRRRTINTRSQSNLNDTLLTAAVNLSDDSSDQISQETINTSLSRSNAMRLNKSSKTYFLRNSNNQPQSSSSHCLEESNKAEDYVKIPKSEYEEIKNRVSAIESRISQEFKTVNSEGNNTLTENLILNVQNEYEKTLQEASIESTLSADQLAKRLSRELKIRKSAEHKVVRSPSARKIGSMRRRSQDRPIRKLQRTSTWHVPDRSYLRNSFKSEQHLNNIHVKCNLKRGRPMLKRDVYKSSEATPKSEAHTFCSKETNERLQYLQEQLNNLISQTAEHTKGSFSDDYFDNLLEDDLHQLDREHNTSGLRRASSFHSGEFIDNSQYFNNRIRELQKSSQKLEVSKNINDNNVRKEKAVSWKDADVYFNQDNKTRTPVPQTGRASLAKLRNTGLVLAKAKLFDENSTKEPAQDKSNVNLVAKIPRIQKIKSMDNDFLPLAKINSQASNKVNNTPKATNVTLHRTPENKKLSCPQNARRQTYQKTMQKENRHITDNLMSVQKMNSSPLIHYGTSVNAVSSPSCRTPRIKKPLNVKTPKSAKSLSRRAPTSSRRTPLKAVIPITPKRSPRISARNSHLNRHA